LQKLSALKQTGKDAWIKLLVFMITKASVDTRNIGLSLVAAAEGKTRNRFTHRRENSWEGKVNQICDV